MCVDFIDLNGACPKDSFSLLSIDRLIDASAGHCVLSFMDAFGVEVGKFLSFMVSQRGIEINLEKIQAILEMASPKSVKDI